MRVKICGLFRDEDIAYANEALPDYAGFVFAPQSRRRVSPAAAARLRERLSPAVTAVGVFVNAPRGEIVSLYRGGIIGMVQLHGGEDAAYLAELKACCDAPLIRAVPVAGNDPPVAAEDLKAARLADYVLLDNGAGGTGKRFDWHSIPKAAALLFAAEDDASACLARSVFLAGGIGAGSIAGAARYRPFALDVSSGAESGGFKDREKMIAIVKAARAFAP
ncbi:MAG: phosphoribosylanthranilate isomerase [Treponema sp.]|nr:phosphoribosylanthranilate isomerase [Treponema sp.]